MRQAFAVTVALGGPAIARFGYTALQLGVLNGTTAMIVCPAAIAEAENSRTSAVFDKGQCLLDGLWGSTVSFSGGAREVVSRVFWPRWERRAHNA